MDLFFVADDFTGGVDVLLQMARGGQRAEMFLSEEAFTATDPSELGACAGVATTYRGADLDVVAGGLSRILDHAAAAQPRVIQYKICSTADSSPTLGSIRPAFDDFLSRGAQRIGLLVAQPSLRRYTVFGNHFANDSGRVYRLDRQPTMSNHPSTPMHEADLTAHFEQQVGEALGNITIEDLASPDAVSGAWRREDEAGHRLVVLDAVRAEDAERQGTALLEHSPAYVIGSGGATLGIGAGLGWHSEDDPLPAAPAASGPVLVVAGSLSRLTATQISRISGEDSWTVLEWDPSTGLPLAGTADAISELRRGQNVLIHSGGARRDTTNAPAKGLPVSEGLAHVAREALGAFSRLVVVGGDTSGEVLSLLGATRLTTTSILDGMTCLCLVDGITDKPLEVALKGGQIGTPDFFVHAADGEGTDG